MVDGDRITGVGELLTEREREILACLVEGLSNGEIAARLHLAVKTVKWYNSQIYSKLGVTKRQEAIEIAVANSADQKALSTHRHNLPAQTTPFVGRVNELAEIARLLGDPLVKLVTILAPGGMGKTRLALEAARQPLSRFADGVFFVPLVAARSIDDVVTAIAENVGFGLFGNEEPRQQLLYHFRERKTLLLLDNFEHLVENATLVADLGQGAPDVKVLVTSREKLNLSGESVLTLSGLDFPDGSTSEAGQEYDAVKLFMQSAQQVRSNFELSLADRSAVARICHLTAGMPLALVLAARWLDVLTLEQIAIEIRKGIDILETEMRDIPERQRSVRATLNTSWEWLAEAERAAFMKLSVFRGGFTGEAAQRVAGANIRLLRALANKALIQTLPGGRYDVHELLRQYAEEKLNETGAVDSVKQMHSRYYLGFLAQRRETIHSPKMIEILDEIAADFDNIRAAWHCAVSNRDDQLIGSAVESLTWYCDRRARFFEHEELYGQAQERFAPSAGEKPLLVWVQLMARRAALIMQFDPNDEKVALCRSFYEQSLAVVHQHYDPFETAYVTYRWGDFLARTRNLNALASLEQSLALFQELGHPFYVSECWIWMAKYYENNSMFEQAFDYLERCADLKLRVGDKNGAGWTFWSISYAKFRQGQYIEADYAMREALRLVREVNNPVATSNVMNALAYLAFRRGDLENARHMSGETLKNIVDARSPAVEFMVTELLVILECIQEELLTTLECIQDEVYERALRFSDHSYRTGFPYIAGLGWIALCGLERYEDARRAIPFILEKTGAKLTVDTLTLISPLAAIILANQGQEERAVELFGLTFAQPTAYVGWVSRWGLVTRLLARLETDLGTDVYAAAWERGAVLDLEAVVEGLLVELGERGS